MADPTRYLTVPEAMLMRWWNTRHDTFDIFGGAGTLTPTSNKKIVLAYINLATDMTGALVTIACTGSDTVTLRYSASAPWRAGEALYIGATNEDVSFTKGGSSGTYFEVWVGWYEL